MPIAIIVEFDLHPGAGPEFDRIMRPHAEATLASEPGCRRFDRLQPLKEDGTPDENRRMLYEVYEH